MIQPHPTPAERFAELLRYMQQAVAVRVRSGLIAASLCILICQRVELLRRRFARLAARIAAGTFRPRRPCTRKPSENPKPRQPNPLPGEFGWLLPLLPWVAMFPDTAVTCRGRLEQLLDDPEMQALMAAAPAEMGRILRPLCWMLQLKPPPILARRRPAAPPPAAPAAAAPPLPPPPPAEPPDPPQAQPEPAPPVRAAPVPPLPAAARDPPQLA